MSSMNWVRETEAHVEAGPDWFVVQFAAGEPARSAFHYRWLRHHTKEDRHPQTGERTLCSSDLPDDLAPLSYRLVRRGAGSTLSVEWSDARTTEHELAWLQRHAYAGPADIPVLRSVPLGAVEIHRAQRSFEDVARDALERVHQHGVAVVRAATGASPQEETERWIEALVAVGLGLTSTHFGRIEDLRPDNSTNANTDQLGYTDAPIQLHTDQAFLEEPPRYQLLQAIVQADGGENVFVDGRAASDYFAGVSAHDHALLASLPVRFSRRQKSFARELDSPILRLAAENQPFRIRYSYFSLAPLSFPFALMPGFYRAHDAFARLLREPARGLRVALAPGDFALYDNHRMLHARLPFQGPRWVRGVYFDQGAGI